MKKSLFVAKPLSWPLVAEPPSLRFTPLTSASLLILSIVSKSNIAYLFGRAAQIS